MSCYVCGSTNVEYHHMVYGRNRKMSDKYGLILPLCPEHHRGKYSPHFNKELDLEIKRMAQRQFEEIHGHDAWVRVMGINYLWED